MSRSTSFPPEGPLSPRSGGAPGLLLLLASLAALLGLATAPAGEAAAQRLGHVQGRVLAASTGEPVAYANLALVPADSSRKKTGGLGDGDGSFRIGAEPGLYTLQVQAISYRKRLVDGVRVLAGQVATVSVTLEPEALVQDEVVVEAEATRNTERGLLAQRKKALTVGDAVSAEQVGRSPDRDAAEVLRRVTGLSVVDGKYVYVRGLGERYSSTEVDGVRLVSPEPNKRVVPMDLLPAGLIDNVVVQKTYTAERPGEFGGGDVQVRTKDFPGRSSFSVAFSQGVDQGTTFEEFRTYPGGPQDWLGFGAGHREMPQMIRDLAGGQPVVYRGLDPTRGFTPDTMAAFARSFSDEWNAEIGSARPNGSFQQTFGDQFSLFGKPLGVVQSFSYGRNFNSQDERQRFFTSVSDTVYNYDVLRAAQSVQLGGMAAVSYRLARAHSLHLRGLFSQNSDDEVRQFRGVDYNDRVPQFGTRLQYTQRSVFSASLAGKHELPALHRSQLDWRLTRSAARRRQPDRRETIYEEVESEQEDGTPYAFYALSGDLDAATRMFSDQVDDGWGAEGAVAVPVHFGPLGLGKLTGGVSRQETDRDAFLRRFNFKPAAGADRSRQPEELFAPGAFDGSPTGARVEEITRPEDNYTGSQRLTAGFVSAEVPWGDRLRGVLGVRVEHGVQRVRSFDLFEPEKVVAMGDLDDVDWLPSVNLAYALGPAVSLRGALSRTLSRPDLRELSPTSDQDMVGGLRVSGNPELRRARVDNYDLRVESLPGTGEVVALGMFYKRLHDPIEQVIRGGDAPILVPENSEFGRNVGIELEARADLGRYWRPLRGLAVNANCAWIDSKVRIRKQLTEYTSREHPLQGQAAYVINGSLSYATAGGAADATVLVSAAGRRLDALGVAPRPDVYAEPYATVDAALNWRFVPSLRVKLAARNLFDAEVRTLQGGSEVAVYRSGRSFGLTLAYGL
jgi:outer membrane receptor protein involved in Fe transport